MCTLHFFRGVTLIFLLLFTSYLLGCFLFENDYEPIVDYVDVVRWTLVADPGGLCMGHKCLLTLRTEYKWSSGRTTWGGYCCRKCERYRDACQIGQSVLHFDESNLPIAKRIKIPPHWPSPGLVLWTRSGGVNPFITRDLCETRYSSSVLEGENLRNFEQYLNELVRYFGSDVGLDPNSNNPRDVCLHVTRDEPNTEYDENGNEGYVAARISCAAGAAARARNCRYMIILWDKAFIRTNSCPKTVYNTIAHEFKHILQSIELGLPTGQCDQIYDNAQYEQEADQFADLISEDCCK